MAKSVFAFGSEHITVRKGLMTFGRMPKQSAATMNKYGFITKEDPFTQEFMKMIKEDFKFWADQYPEWLVKEIKEA